MPKFFVKTNQIKENTIEIVGEDVKHILQVLRAKKGEKLNLCDDNTGKNYITIIEQIEPEKIVCHIVKETVSVAESKLAITLFQGMPKSDKLEYIIQKNIELGVKQIVPVVMKRCIVKWNEKEVNKKIERLQKIAISAAKQSGRDTIPKVEHPVTINNLSQIIKEFDLVLLAYEGEQNHTLKAILKNTKAVEGMKIGIIIGPEGGVEKDEVKLLEKAGAKVITLGKRILRTETAAIMVISNIIYEYEM